MGTGYKCSYDYNPEEHIFLWKQFIDEVLPDEGWQHVFQEFLGSIFIDRRTAKIETMLVLRGSGSNGKSVVFETIMGILGRDNVSNFGIGALITGTERKKNIAYINGKRLNYCSEIQALEIGRIVTFLKALYPANLLKRVLCMEIISPLMIFPCLWQMPIKCRI
ncbi:hypothetical protein SFC43_01335 [Bacteroides sp. CR5/BHMF/2]|nr:hypothetical protein [Bacteroides sp. CR5/BHMF/2]